MSSEYLFSLKFMLVLFVVSFVKFYFILVGDDTVKPRPFPPSYNIKSTTCLTFYDFYLRVNQDVNTHSVWRFFHHNLNSKMKHVSDVSFNYNSHDALRGERPNLLNSDRKHLVLKIRCKSELHSYLGGCHCVITVFLMYICLWYFNLCRRKLLTNTWIILLWKDSSINRIKLSLSFYF